MFLFVFSSFRLILFSSFDSFLCYWRQNAFWFEQFINYHLMYNKFRIKCMCLYVLYIEREIARVEWYTEIFSIYSLEICQRLYPLSHIRTLNSNVCLEMLWLRIHIHTYTYEHYIKLYSQIKLTWSLYRARGIRYLENDTMKTLWSICVCACVFMLSLKTWDNDSSPER